MLRAVLFDLDDTLMPDEAAADAALVATGKLAAEWHRILPVELKDAVRCIARRIWRGHPIVAAYHGSYDISSWEALSARFEDSDEETRQLRAWAPAYRQEVWSSALAEFGIADPLLADLLAVTYAAERRARYQPYPDALPLLDQLSREFRLGLVTNGPTDLQQDKLKCSGLEDRFSAVVISRAVGTRKPDPRIFHLALDQLNVLPAEAVYVGDSLSKDVAGAKAAGMKAVWANYDARLPQEGVVPDAVISSLLELPAALKLIV
ncbi:MAG: HAD family hydrolase [candidate division WOR-3 bacterium]